MLFLLIIPGLFTLIAVLIKHFKCYWLISGYNTASKKEKEKFDIEALGNFMGNMLYLMAGVTFAGIGLRYLGFKLIGDLSWFIFLGIMVYMLFKAQGFHKDENPTLRKSTKLILLALTIPTIGLTFIPIIYGVLPSEVVLEDHSLKITGMYGTSIEKDSITSIELLDNIPNVEKKVSGFDFGNTQKGNFQLEEWGRGKIYLQSSKAPYILIRYRENDFILINYNDPAVTKETYQKILNW